MALATAVLRYKTTVAGLLAGTRRPRHRPNYVFVCVCAPPALQDNQGIAAPDAPSEGRFVGPSETRPLLMRNLLSRIANPMSACSAGARHQVPATHPNGANIIISS